MIGPLQILKLSFTSRNLKIYMKTKWSWKKGKKKERRNVSFIAKRLDIIREVKFNVAADNKKRDKVFSFVCFLTVTWNWYPQRANERDVEESKIKNPTNFDSSFKVMFVNYPFLIWCDSWHVATNRPSDKFGPTFLFNYHVSIVISDNSSGTCMLVN